MRTADILLLGALGFLAWYGYQQYQSTGQVILVQPKAPSQTPQYIAAGAGVAGAAAQIATAYF
jgi:TRAP-type C4-dicarboxylate transport system permease small subunit